MSKFLKNNRQALLLLALLIAYVTTYFVYPLTPGNNPKYPAGWFGWFDQGQYLKEALAIAQLKFTPGNYFYPPLYPALGAIFVKWLPTHPFLLVNIAGFLIFAHFFIDLARRFVGWPCAVIFFLLSLLPARHMVALWIEPWTTTLVAPIFAYLFWELWRIITSRELPSIPRAALMGGLGGAIFATRPADAVVISPVFIMILWQFYLIGSHQSAEARRNTIFRAASLCAAGLFFVGCNLAFNQLVYGNLLGSYFEVSTSRNGFQLLDFPEKAVSIFLDGETLYGPEGDAILAKMRWLALMFPGVIYAIFAGPALFRLILTVMAVQLLIYLPYSDLLPSGIWKYHNIHYFKWMFPYFWLIGFYPLFTLRGSSGTTTTRWGLILSTLAASLLLSVRLELIDVTAQVSITQTTVKEKPAIQIQSTTPLTLDVITLPTIRGSYQNTYFGFDNTVQVDDNALMPVRDFRLFPLRPGTQLVFIRPITGANILLQPKELTISEGPLNIRCYQYRYTLGRPAWF
ncbi:MAG TPA: hypothetical protein VFM46_10490 [Pseudomonadales bacterium]|nr:hypothetical protein [Pseudomonadales bacterium]